MHYNLKRNYWQFIVAFFTAVLFVNIAFAAPTFPTLTGRIVDKVNLLSLSEKARIEKTLELHELSTNHQIAVAIVPSLQGLTIEEYSYQLGRIWGIGQKEKNNGVLLLVAPQERQVRIEVGYGLEGKLTDAISSQIIQNIILTNFKKNDYSTGIREGVIAIINIIAITPSGKAIATTPSQGSDGILGGIFLLIALAVIIMVLRSYRVRNWKILELFINIILLFLGGGGKGGGSSKFGGKGGGFGGGGSSGKW